MGTGKEIRGGEAVMRVGCTIDYFKGADLVDSFRQLKEMGMNSCQLVCWDRSVLDAEHAAEVKKICEDEGIEISAVWCGWEGPRFWNFYEGQDTLGLVPEAYRFKRIEMLAQGSDFAKELGVTDLVTHAGYMPENPHDPKYPEIITALKYLVRKCKQNGQYFLFETGQETPVTLLRVMQDIGFDNVGINLDPANLIMYGKANPVDSLDVFGTYVRGVHGKDGLYPTDGRELGDEVALGEGKVNFPVFLKKLHELGYDGDITIEREITGEQQKKDIQMAKKMLDEIISGLE